MRSLMFVALAGLWTLGATQDLEAQAGTLRIGYIDSQAILQQAPGAQEAQAEFDRQMQRWQAEIEEMGADLDSMITEYQQQQSTLLENVRQARETAIQQQQQRYQNRIQEINQEQTVTEQQLIEPIFTRMNEVIEQMRAEGDYAVIFDLAAQSIVAADTSLDLTEEVLRRLQQMGAPETPDAPATDSPGTP